MPSKCHLNIPYWTSGCSELNGRRKNEEDRKYKKDTSKQNLPEAFQVYSMRQAIEEGFILDVLKNYTNYKVAYNLALKVHAADFEVERKKTKSFARIVFE